MPKNRTQIIKELKATNQLKARCPFCEEEFTLSKAILFDASAALPDIAAEKVEQRKTELVERATSIRDEQAELRQRKHSATDGAEKKAMEVGLGLVLEKIVTGWQGFPHAPYDCRSLFEPIDYVAFDGMTENQQVDQIAFLDVKSGKARLNRHQNIIREAVNDHRVEYKEV